ncbi:hypothetical protein AK830_g8596 [Neonectria ditissima]|uniref:Uncharacterized protein n=1 Tax=Neonectria ditissima TaxID=78410 RepID=A0A0P7AX03_9HYPO|nr:hypothetical protein AK830_g8596 [Neonectria ditissima]
MDTHQSYTVNGTCPTSGVVCENSTTPDTPRATMGDTTARDRAQENSQEVLFWKNHSPPSQSHENDDDNISVVSCDSRLSYVTPFTSQDSHSPTRDALSPKAQSCSMMSTDEQDGKRKTKAEVVAVKNIRPASKEEKVAFQAWWAEQRNKEYRLKHDLPEGTNSKLE